MTLVAGSFTTFLAVGNREDLSDVITNITPNKTPVWSSSPKTKATNVNHEWQTDAYATPATNAQLEGDAVTASTAAATTRLNNRCQISNKTYGVTKTQRAANSAGRGDELMYQRMKFGVELRRDCEVVILSNQASTAGGASSARQLAGLPSWITNVVGSSVSAATGNGTDTATAPTANATAMTYELLASAMQLAYEDGGSPRVCYLSPRQKRAFTNLAFGSSPSTAQIRYNLTQSEKVTAVGAVESWQGDFGMIDIVPHQIMALQSSTFMQRAVFLVDPDHLNIAIYRDFEVDQLGKTGSADREFVEIEYTLEVTGPTAHAAAYGMVN